MMAWLNRQLDAMRGQGETTATVPPMDGALRPNNALESARIVLQIPQPDNLVAADGGILFTSGTGVFALDANTGMARLLRTFDAPVSSLAACGDLIAAGLYDGSVQLFREHHEATRLLTVNGTRLVCPVALAFRDPATLIVCQGSNTNPPDCWRNDLLEGGRSGTVWQVSLPNGHARLLASGLGFPCGVAVQGDDLLVAESWRHRVLTITATGTTPALADLPGYPGRLCAADNGWWLCVFAPRSQLTEFILRERGYRERMMREITPEYWLAPTLVPATNFLEPMQGGALRTHGMLKPWAPSLSYGLLIRLDAALRPIASYHSRADGTVHGITSCLDRGSEVLFTSKGANAILALRADEGALA